MALRWVARELSGWGARLVFFVGCVAVGVAAVVAVAALAAALEDGLRAQARPLLGADLVVEGRSPVPDAVRRALEADGGVELTEVREMASMMARDGRRGDADGGDVGGADGDADGGDVGGRGDVVTLVQLRAVGPGWPFFGAPTIVPDRPVGELLDGASVLVAPELARALDVGVGSRVRLGGRTFTVRGLIEREPDRSFSGFRLGPRAIITLDALARTSLEGRGSRVRHRLLARVDSGEADPERLEAVAASAEDALGGQPFHEIETWREGRPELRESLGDAEGFLGLVALLSLLVGGVGVARTVEAWLARRTRAVAVLRCLGMRSREIVALHLAEVMAIALVGSVLGALLGLGAAALVAALAADLLPLHSAGPAAVFLQPLAALRGVALGLAVAAIFAAAPLAELRRLPPSRILRAEAEPTPPGRVERTVQVAVLAVGLVALASAQSGSLLRGLGFTAGIAAAAAVLAGAAHLVRRAAVPLARWRLAPSLRHGVAALARPASGTVSVIVALGLGVLAVTGTLAVERQLRDALQAALPQDAPTAFLVDVQPDQWEGVREILESAGSRRIDSVPMVTARIAAIDGRSTAAIEEARASEDDRPEDRRWALTREQRLTWLAELPEGNEIIEGAWWSLPEERELSVERDFAEDLGVALGSTLVLDVQGVPVELVVSSIREVEWRTFGINFFLVVEPGVLEGAPHSRIAAARVPDEALPEVRVALAHDFPNVVVLPVRELLESLASVLELVGLGVRLLGAFSVAAGLAILAGVVSAGSVRRAREVALMRTLGATRRQVVAAFLTEHALVGLVAGVIGVASGVVLSWAVLTFGMELGWQPPWAVAIAGVAATMLLAAAAGTAACAGALREHPIAVLRRE